MTERRHTVVAACLRRLVRRAPALALGAGIAIALPTAATAQSDAPELDAPLMPGLARIVDRGTLIVGQAAEAVPPLSFKNEAGERQGIDVTLARALAADLGVDLQLRTVAETRDGVLAAVAAGSVDLAISGFTISSLRARYVLFSRPYVRQHYALVMHRLSTMAYERGCPGLMQFLNTTDAPLGIRAGSTVASLVHSIDADRPLKRFDSYAAMLAAVTAGEVAASVQDELIATDYLDRHPAAHIRVRVCVLADRQDLIGIAVPPDRPDVLSWVNVFLQVNDIEMTATEAIAWQARHGHDRE